MKESTEQMSATLEKMGRKREQWQTVGDDSALSVEMSKCEEVSGVMLEVFRASNWAQVSIYSTTAERHIAEVASVS